MFDLKQARRVVVKLGTGVLTSGIGQLDTERIERLAHDVTHLRDLGIEVVLVSSGAVGLGMGKLGLERRPRELAALQACAAVGQSILINTWQRAFDPHGVTVAQVLLTREDLRIRHRHNAVFDTIERLLAKGAVPVVNENDTVSAAEIKFGDNDTLSALVASVVNAQFLFILSNIPGLIDLEGNGEVIPVVDTITPEIEALARGTRQATSVGGMISKLAAAKIARRAGCTVFIGSGADPGLFEAILAGRPIGTCFKPSAAPVKSHKRWLAIQDHVFGSIVIDEGARRAIVDSGKSLLAAGVTACEGAFETGDTVRLSAVDGNPVAHGLPEMNAAELQAILDTPPAQDTRRSPVVVHRDNLVLAD